MIPAEILKKIRALEIKTRHIVSSTFSGEYHSVFKGQGINFAEVRAYAPGDDVRLIDWKVTAKTGDPFVKVFEEERELTALLMVDLSASGDFGSGDKSKAEIMAEIAAILGFSAIRNNDKVGLLLFSDDVERYIAPNKGKEHVMRILRDIFYLKPKSRKTSIGTALEYLMKINKKKAIVFVISDFIDPHFHQAFRAAAKRHDVVPIVVEDPRERELPKAGLVTLEDEESGEMVFVNTRSNKIRQKYHNMVVARDLEMERFFKSINVTPIRVDIGKPYEEALMGYFKSRAKRF